MYICMNITASNIYMAMWMYTCVDETSIRTRDSKGRTKKRWVGANKQNFRNERAECNV